MSEDLDAGTILVEPKEQLATAKKCMRSELTSWFVFMLLSIWNISLHLESTWPTEFIEYGGLTLCWIMLFVFSAALLSRGLWFYLKNKQNAAREKQIVFPKSIQTVWFHRITTLILAIGLAALTVGLFMGERNIFLCVLISVAATCGVAYFGAKLVRDIGSKKSKVQQVIVIVVVGIVAAVITVIIAVLFTMFDSNDKQIEYYDEYGNTIRESVSDDDIPLTLEDLGVDTTGLIKADTCSEKYFSILGTVNDCWQNYYKGNDEEILDCSYNIVDCRFGWVKDKLIEEYLNDEYFKKNSPFTDITNKEAALWNAEKVYAAIHEDDGYSRLVVYEDKVLFITNSEVDYTEIVIRSIRTELADWFK